MPIEIAVGKQRPVGSAAQDRERVLWRGGLAQPLRFPLLDVKGTGEDALPVFFTLLAQQDEVIPGASPE